MAQRLYSVIRLVLLLVILLPGFFRSAVAANDRAFFWQIESAADATATVYLMGSIHFADDSFYPLRKEIEQAFNHADYLVVELDVNQSDHVKYNEILVKDGVFKDGTTIRDVITDETWRQLRQRLHHLNISYENIKHYKPGVLVLTLSALQVMKLGFEPEFGIDAYFLAKAKRQDGSGATKNIIELETLEQQLNLFLNIPDAELLLKESLYSLDESELLMADMVRYWKTGDEKQMEKILFADALLEYPAFSAIYDKLFYDRNRQMTVKINTMLNSKGVYFVVVGSGHLIGEKGIVNALRKKGHEVERL